MTPLYERVRPRTLDGVVGQPRAVAAVQRIMAQGVAGGAYLFLGPTASGKTTLSRIMAAEIAAPHFVEEVNGAEIRTAAQVRDLANRMHLWGGGLFTDKGGRACIVNEVHRLKADAIACFLDVLEDIPEHSAWFFTTTWDGADQLFDEKIDASPLMGRCMVIRTTNQGTAQAYAELAYKVANDAGLNGQPMDKYLGLVRKHKGNLRAVLQDIQGGAMVAE